MAAARAILEMYEKVVRALVMTLAVLAALAVLAMMSVTCVDVAMRIFGTALSGANDLICVAGALAAGCALPYTTAVKGHVAVEYFFHKLGRVGRVVVDTLMRATGIALFGALSWCCFREAHMSYMPAGVSMSRGYPWLLYALACGCFAAAVLVVSHIRQQRAAGHGGWAIGKEGGVLALLLALFLWRLVARVAQAASPHSAVAGNQVEVYDSLPIPKASVMYMLSFCCAVVVLVILHNLLHPGREMIKP
jgi:TRAP-type C4-dicarboxylate transport system permease small subunit